MNENAGRYHLYFFIIAARLSVNIIFVIVPAQMALFFILANGFLVFMIILFLFRRKLGHYGRRSLALA